MPVILTECLARLGAKPLFVSAVGGDPLGSMLLRHCEETRMVREHSCQLTRDVFRRLLRLLKALFRGYEWGLNLRFHALWTNSYGLEQAGQCNMHFTLRALYRSFLVLLFLFYLFVGTVQTFREIFTSKTRQTVCTRPHPPTPLPPSLDHCIVREVSYFVVVLLVCGYCSDVQRNLHIQDAADGDLLCDPQWGRRLPRGRRRHGRSSDHHAATRMERYFCFFSRLFVAVALVLVFCWLVLHRQSDYVSSPGLHRGPTALSPSILHPWVPEVSRSLRARGPEMTGDASPPAPRRPWFRSQLPESEGLEVTQHVWDAFLFVCLFVCLFVYLFVLCGTPVNFGNLVW